MAAPEVASVGTLLSGSSSTSANFAVPSGVVGVSTDPTEVIVVVLWVDNSEVPTPATDFVQASSSPAENNNGGAQNFFLRVYWKRASAADSGTYDFSFGSSPDYRLGYAFRLTGCVQTGDPFDDTDAPTAGNYWYHNIEGYVLPDVSVTTTGADRLLLHTSANWGGGGSWTPPSGFTTEVSTFADVGLVIATKEQASAGSSGAFQGTYPSGATVQHWLGAVKPAEAGPSESGIQRWTGSAWADSAEPHRFFDGSDWVTAPAASHVVLSDPDPLGAGERAGLGTVGYLGSPGLLTVLNPDDATPGGWSASWDDSALIVDGDDVTIDHYRINGSVIFFGDDPTMTNCEIYPTADDIYGVTVNGSDHGVLTITDTSVIGSNTFPGQSTAISSDSGLVAIRCDVSQTTDGIHLVAQADVNDAVISQCCIHDLVYLDEEQHLDGIQTFSHDTVEGFLKVEHNYVGRSVDAEDTPMSAGIFITSTTLETEFITPVVDNNHIESGAYHLRLLGNLQDMVVTNNDFGPLYAGEFGLVDTDASPDILTWSNNRDSDDELITEPS